jgi:hypothetical protein
MLLKFCNTGIMEKGVEEWGLLTARLAALEARVEALEGAAHPSGVGAQPAEGRDDQMVRDEGPAGGWISFAGEVDRQSLDLTYSWKRAVNHVLDSAWEEGFHRISSLAHPVRGAILRRLFEGPSSVVDLINDNVVSSTGAAYHHLNELAASGWVVKSPQGLYRIPPARIVPLLVAVAASEEHR